MLYSSANRTLKHVSMRHFTAEQCVKKHLLKLIMAAAWRAIIVSIMACRLPI